MREMREEEEEIVEFARKWMELKIIMSHEISQTQKNKLRATSSTGQS